MARCARVAPALLLHVNLLLAAYGGVALATAARLKWDPSTYVVVRELFPAEYRAAAGVLCAAGAALLLLAHLAAAAVAAAAQAPRTARAMLLTYAWLMALVLAGEAAFGAWLARRAAAWLGSPAAAQLLEALELRDHVRPLLDYFGRWHPLPQHINALVEEATVDAPRNGYAALALAMLLALLQAAAVVLAALAAIGAGASAPAAAASTALQRTNKSYSWSSADGDGDGAGDEAQPLRTAYKNGRIVVL